MVNLIRLFIKKASNSSISPDENVRDEECLTICRIRSKGRVWPAYHDQTEPSAEKSSAQSRYFD